MKVVVYNLGCKVNQYESDSILTRLKNIGYEVSENLEYADAYVLNTCAVTNEAEKKSRQAVARCLHFNKNAKIIVCGCASQNNQEQFAIKDNVTIVSGVAGKNMIPEMLQENGIYVKEVPTEYENDAIPDVVRTRAYVKIQDGCNNFCSYCLIPYLRGRSRSRSVDSIVEECEQLQEKTKEIVLTGIDMSSYGKNIGESLTSLLEKLQHIDVRIRFGSLEANVIDDEFLQATQKLKKFCPHFHLSLQSGDNDTLKSMNRKYTTDFYAERVDLIRKYYPNAGITTDLICGFPTETDEQFANTLAFIDKIKFSDMHIFAYSKREGTVASKYKMLNADLVKERTKMAEEIALKNKKEFAEKFIGKQVEVLFEDDGGYTREYVRVGNFGTDGELKCVTPSGYDNKEKYLLI